MANTERFNRSIAALTNAYMNDTLESGDYCGCAVGNLIADANGFKVVNSWGELNWETPLDSPMRNPMHWFNVINPDVYHLGHESIKIGLQQIESTGYSINEITRIEKAFEQSYTTAYNRTLFKGIKEDAIFMALVAVYDLLVEIDGIDKADVKSAELVFVK